MMKSRKGIFFFILIAMLLSLLPTFSACGGLEHPYEEFAHVGFMEPYAYKASVLEGKKFTLGEHTVYLDDCYSDGKKESLLTFAETVFERIPSPAPLTIYIGTNYSSRTDGENLYLATIDHTVFLHTYLQYVGERTLNFGLLWGVSEHLRAELEGDKPKVNAKKAKEYLNGNPYLIEMEAPLFFAPFSEEEDIEKVKTVSVSFAEWLYENEGNDGVKKLLERDLAAVRSPLDEEVYAEFNTAFTEKKNAYLQGLGLDFSAEEEENFYRYAPFTVRFPLEIGTEWGKVYIRGDYYAEENQVVHDYCRTFSSPDYKSLKGNLTWLDESAETLLDAFSLEMRDVPDYTWFLDQDTHFFYHAGGFVNWEMQSGNLSNLCEFPHEFTHEIESMLVMRDHTYDYKWLTEGLADYAALVLTPKPDFQYESMEKDLETEPIKRIFDMLRPTSDSDLHAWKDAQAVWSVLNGYHTQKDNFTYYFRYCSFVYYLVERIGWENFLAFLNAPKTFHAVFGESQYMLWTAWANDLFARAGEGSAPEDFSKTIC